MAQFPGPQRIDAPAHPVPETGILYSVPVTDVTDPRLLHSGVTFETDGATADLRDVDFASYADCIRTATKIFDDGLDYVETFGFSLYRAIVCRPGAIGGGDEAEYRERARRRYDIGESFALERHIKSVLETGNAAVPAAVALAPVVADGLKPIEGISLLFGALGNVYVPNILAGRAVGVKLNEDDAVAASGGNLVIGAGFDETGGVATVYGTGPIHIWRGEPIVTVVPDDENNNMIVLVERQYIVSIEGPTYKVDVRYYPAT